MKKSTRMAVLLTLLSMALTGCARPAKEQTVALKLGGDAPADTRIEALVSEAAELLKTHGPQSEAVWPGYDLARNDIIVCLRQGDTVTHAWRLTTEGKTDLTNKQLADVEIPAAGGYNSLTFEGRKGIIISLNDETLPSLEKVAKTNCIYEIGVHEMVHFHYESPLKLLKLANEQKKHGGRGTAFPKAAEPRAYRKMLYDNLVLAFEYPEEEALYLGRAKYWNEKWKAEFPAEFYQSKITDIMEGKARYIQYMLCMPEGLNAEGQAAWIAERFDREEAPAVSMDTESYRLGFAAGALLDRQGTDWKTRVSKKPQPLVEVLLETVEPVEDSSENYEEMLDISVRQMAEVNETLTQKLADIRKAEADVSIPYLQLNQKYLEGSFETTDFLNDRGNHLVVDFGGTFTGRKGTVIVKGLTVYEQDGTYILPLTMDWELTEGQLKLSGGASGETAVKQTRDKNGRTVLIMQ